MKPRAEWLNDILIHTKPGRHKDKRKKTKHRDLTDEAKAVKEYKRIKQELSYDTERDYDE